MARVEGWEGLLVDIDVRGTRFTWQAMCAPGTKTWSWCGWGRAEWWGELLAGRFFYEVRGKLEVSVYLIVSVCTRHWNIAVFVKCTSELPASTTPSTISKRARSATPEQRSGLFDRSVPSNCSYLCTMHQSASAVEETLFDYHIYTHRDR